MDADGHDHQSTPSSASPKSPSFDSLGRIAGSSGVDHQAFSFANPESAQEYQSPTSIQPRSEIFQTGPNLSTGGLQIPVLSNTIIQEGKTFEPDEEKTFQRFQKGPTNKASTSLKTIQRMATMSQKSFKGASSTTPNASPSFSDGAFFMRNKTNRLSSSKYAAGNISSPSTPATGIPANPAPMDWLPISSIWTSRKALSRQEVQATLFVVADILSSSNMPHSYSTFKKRQAANDDSSNFRDSLAAETPTPLRIFEIADRVAGGGGPVDPGVDLPVVGWFLKLLAASPGLCTDIVDVVADDCQCDGNDLDCNREIFDPEKSPLNRTLFKDERIMDKIESEDIVAMTAAKVEHDSAQKADASAGFNLVVKDPSTISDQNGKSFKYLIVDVTDDYGSNHRISVDSNMTLAEIKEESLRRFGICDVIDRHDIFGIDANNNDIPLDLLNVPIVPEAGSSSNMPLRFRLRRKKPIAWNLPVRVCHKNTVRYISVDCFTTADEVSEILAKLEAVQPREWTIYNGEEPMQPLETFDPWSDTKNYAFTRKIVPFSEKYENPAFSISVEQLEPPCGPTYKSKGAKGGISKNRGAVSDSGSEVRLSNASMPSESRPKSLKSRLLAGFVGLKNRDDDEESESKSSSPNVSTVLFSSTDFIVARFYYGNAAYTTLKLPRGTTVASAVQAVMDKLLIKDSADEYGLYIQRKNVDGACEIEKNQDVSAIVKSLKDTEMLLFKRKHRMESQLRSGVIDATVLSAASSVEPTSETSAQATGPQFSDDDEGCDMEKGRISVSQRYSKTGDAYLRARNLKRWTKTVEAKELCRVLGIFGTSKTVESDVFKQKKLVHQKLPKEGWLMIRDEFNEWVSVWVSVNSEEVKLLLSSLDATTYVFPSSRVMVHVSKTVENENGRHVFVIADRQNVGASFFVAAKTFVEMESWVERLKCFSGESSSELASSEHDSSPFQICRVYGESENGQLLLCEQKTTKQAFSVKIWKKSNKPTLDMELKILRAIRHSFIIKLHAIFETSSQSFLVLDYVDGGELYQQVSNFGKFTEDRARFYAAEILLALEFLHGHRIVYRGLALEKVFLNREGHVVISEFGTARMEHNSDVGLRVGQLEYLAPETLHGQGTSYATDWWALGIVLYEMMCASHPFFHEQKCQLEENILNTVLKFPKHLSANAKSVLSGLITRDTTKRLGSNGGEDILRNQFFDKLDVIRVANRETEAPWKPEVLDAMDEELLGEPELFDERDEGQLQ